MKKLLLLMTLSMPSWAWAVDWPSGTAPCNSTLLACVEGSPAYTTIFINTDSTINENIFTSNPVSLIAGKGYKPIFSSGNGIEMTNVTDSFRSVIIEGLTFERGRIAYHLLGGTADSNVYIRNNTVLDNSSTLQNIRILNSSNQTLNVELDYNHLTYTSSTSDQGPRGAITIRSGAAGNTTQSGTISGRIYGNTITASGSNTIGVGVFAYAQTDVDMDIAGNEFSGGNQAALYVFRNDGTGSTDLNIGNNAFYASSSSENFRGVQAVASSGTIDLNIVNNTALGAFDAFNFDEQAGAVVDVYLYNNIMAFGDAAVWTDAATAIVNDYNLLHGNPTVDGDFTPGPNSLSSNPMVTSMKNARLRPGSPAIEAGSTISLLALGGSPFVDADGTHRLKKGNDSGGAQQVDIGAYETGDLYFTHRVNTAGSHISTLYNDELDCNAGLDDLHVSANWNPPGSPGIYNNHDEGIWYNGSNWTVFNQDQIDLSLGAAFNVHKYASTSYTFEHTVSTAGDNSTQLDNANLNDQSDRILQVTQNWTGTYNPHPVGVFYFSGFWYIVNTDLQNIPSGSHFNVYSQPPSKSAWVHTAVAANSFGNVTTLDNPLINGVPCAEVQVTQSADGGEFNDAPIGVYYNGIDWTVYNQDSSDMVANSEFHVTVNPEQIAACSDVIFADDFE